MKIQRGWSTQSQSKEESWRRNQTHDDEVEIGRLLDDEEELELTLVLLVVLDLMKVKEARSVRIFSVREREERFELTKTTR